VFSGLSPLVATTLIRESGQVVSPAYVMIASAVIALAGSLAVRRYGTGALEVT